MNPLDAIEQVLKDAENLERHGLQASSTKGLAAVWTILLTLPMAAEMKAWGVVLTFAPWVISRGLAAAGRSVGRGALGASVARKLPPVDGGRR